MIRYALTLHADAEPGSGLGGEIVNNYISRDHRGRAIIGASHIKGLVRQTLYEILEPLEADATSAIDALLGAPGAGPKMANEAVGSGSESVFRFTDCVLDDSSKHAAGPGERTITRTALDDTGTIAEGSLRTTEAVAAGSTFHGTVHGSGTPAAEALLGLGLLGLRAVGAGRTRGGGLCSVTLEGEERTPSEWLRTVCQQLAADDAIAPASSPASAPRITASDSDDAAVVWLELAFYAESPLLCPETPEAGNVLRSGLSVPASAVQGALLHRLNQLDPELASRCFESPIFRAWPLQPEPVAEASESARQLPVRVSLTHKAAKFAIRGEWEFADEAIDDPGAIRDRPDRAPLKAADGVLLPGERDVRLWRAVDMPRVVSTHGVHNGPNGDRALYTVEAMAPLVWRGLIACPPDAAAALEHLLAQDPRVAFGKARSVRGAGRLSLQRRQRVADGLVTTGAAASLLIAQAPIALPATFSDAPVQEQLQQLAGAWAEHHGLGAVDAVWATAGLRFGWNRHQKTDGGTGRTSATRVILPGAVIRLRERPDSQRLEQALLAGLGEGRERGYGAMLPHPGRADSLYRDTPQPPCLASEHANAIKRALELEKAVPQLPSPSQISAVLASLERSPEEARRYLKGQGGRGSHQYSKWQDTLHEIQQWLEGPDEHVQESARISLQVLRDQRAARQKEQS